MADFTDVKLVVAPTLPLMGAGEQGASNYTDQTLVSYFTLVLQGAGAQGPSNYADQKLVSYFTLILQGAGAQGPSNYTGVVNALSFEVSNPDDLSLPVLSAFAPADGAILGANDPISFDVTDALYLGALALTVQVSVYVNSTDTSELAWNGDGWENLYAESTRSNITNGFHFSVKRKRGWPTGGVKIRVRAMDAGRNIGTLGDAPPPPPVGASIRSASDTSPVPPYIGGVVGTRIGFTISAVVVN